MRNIPVWNSLPQDIVNSKTVLEFKTKQDKLWKNIRFWSVTHLLKTYSKKKTPETTTRKTKQEAHGPRFAHLSDIATADMQMLCNIYPILSTNENIIIWAVLSFEEEYMGLTVNGAWSWINYQSHFNRRINVKFGGNWLSGFWRIVILYM